MGRTAFTRLAAALAAPMAISLVVAPAVAQFSDSYNFLKAVKDKDGAKVTELLQGGGGATMINTKDYNSGDAALHIVVKRRDDLWVRFLVAKGANPNIRNREGATPLILAAQISFPEGVASLIAGKADVNMTNDRGETPLIVAVQLRDLATIRLLLAAGADPDKSDHAAGLSARDYAARDPRSGPIGKMLEDAIKARPAKRPVAGPGL